MKLIEELDYPEEKKATYSSYLNYMGVPYSSVYQFLSRLELREEGGTERKTAKIEPRQGK